MADGKWRYNHRVRVRRAWTVTILSARMFAQSTPPSCLADRPDTSGVKTVLSDAL